MELKPMAPTPPPGGNIENRQPPPPPPKKGEGSSSHDLESTVSDILADYDADDLSEEDALAIQEALKEAGIAPTPALAEAMEAVGFDAKEIGDLGRQARDQMPQPSLLSVSEEQKFSQLLASLFDNNETASHEYSSRLSQLNQEAITTLSSLLDNVSKSNANPTKVAVDHLFMSEQSYYKTSFYA